MAQAEESPPYFVHLNDQIAMEFRPIPAGCFRMGSRGEDRDEEPRHWVQITQPFFLGTFPVLQREFELWHPEHENHFKGKPDNPAENMRWDDARDFCAWLNKLNKEKTLELPPGYIAGLPTEAQWEYACRAGTDTEYYTGDGVEALKEAGWFWENRPSDSTQPAGGKKPNRFGLYDMHGNVWEWCRDVYDTHAFKKRVEGVADPAHDDIGENSVRVVRGGSWIIVARSCRSASRYWDTPGNRYRYLGFRVCLFPGPPLVPEQNGPQAEPEAGGGARRQAAAEAEALGGAASVDWSAASFPPPEEAR